MFHSSVNFPVVAGGFALLAATGGVQAVVGAAAPVLSTSFVAGAAGLLGNNYCIVMNGNSFCPYL